MCIGCASRRVLCRVIRDRLVHLPSQSTEYRMVIPYVSLGHLPSINRVPSEYHLVMITYQVHALDSAALVVISGGRWMCIASPPTCEGAVAQQVQRCSGERMYAHAFSIQYFSRFRCFLFSEIMLPRLMPPRLMLQPSPSSSGPGRTP